MPMNKPHLEFATLDMSTGWATPPDYPPGIKQKILASDINESKKMGSRTRLLRFDPGVYTTAPFVHDHWEEVYLLAGDLVVGSDAQGKGGEPFFSPTYACRPPGVRVRSQGLRVPPGNAAANSVVTVLPSTIAPASRKAATVAASRRERQPL